MTKSKIAEAITLAERFCKVAAEALVKHVADMNAGGSKQSAALRRASMDLTRALADMRRP